MSDAEKYYYSIAKHFGLTLNWNQLNPMIQMQIIESVNMLIDAMNNAVNQQQSQEQTDE